jgi:hypothetical protein
MSTEYFCHVRESISIYHDQDAAHNMNTSFQYHNHTRHILFSLKQQKSFNVVS